MKDPKKEWEKSHNKIVADDIETYKESKQSDKGIKFEAVEIREMIRYMITDKDKNTALEDSILEAIDPWELTKSEYWDY